MTAASSGTSCCCSSIAAIVSVGDSLPGGGTNSQANPAVFQNQLCDHQSFESLIRILDPQKC